MWQSIFCFCGVARHKLLLCLTDIAALLLALLAVFGLRFLFGGVDPALYRWTLPLMLLAPVLGAGLGLYQTVALPPHRELRALCQMSSLIYGIVLLALFLSKSGDIYSRCIILGGWVLSLAALPAARALCRRLFARRPWWGRPVVFFARGNDGRRLWRYLKRNPGRGLAPVSMHPLPESPEEARILFEAVAKAHPHAVALLVRREGHGHHVDHVAEAGRCFERILLVPYNGERFRPYWFAPRDLGSAVGLLVRRNLRDRHRLCLKRGLDVFFGGFFFLALLPLGLVLAAAIRLDSPGPVFYRQRRLGRGGRAIRIFKFRTMVTNADAVLQDMLARDAALCDEWNRNHKLRQDPRITRVGRWLRKLSLDELPQLINVLVGDMSLVGPRPIVDAEIEKYGEVYGEYCLVRPGLTGLWQISGRNRTSYAERVSYDDYYINNWSVWMDIWILARTVPIVLTGYGAY